MQIKHAINDPQSMSHDGGKILQSLQNNHLPLIDIIVRESLQNSLDATKMGVEETNVSFKIDTFQSESLAPHFEEINTKLKKDYAGNQQFISFSDRNTFGLTGNYKSTDSKILNKSHFHKLVFGIGQNQDQEGAGGSWGYGKTSYFRIGIGLVIYYTRIKTTVGFEERLIASMIEDPTSNDRLLEKNERGIAWWGELEEDENSRVFPVTDADTIESILSIFNLKRYDGQETGTTIIVPYVKEKEKELLDGTTKRYPWEKNYIDEIKLAVQRWYFPRIMNNVYSDNIGNSRLNISINDEFIIPSFNFEPIFHIYQDIYNAAASGVSNDKSIEIQEIKFGSNALLDTNEIVGRIAFKEVSKKDLKMLAPDNKLNGLKYLGIKDDLILENFNAKVIGYSRKPGMVIEYAVDSKWSPSNINLKEDHILLGFFVPNSNAELIVRFQEAGYKNLESYLRSIESSDHATWEDLVDITLVSRMRNYSTLAIRKHYQSEEEELGTSKTSGLSRKFGSILMPPKNYGRSSSRRRGDGVSVPTGSRNRKSDISIVHSRPINEETVQISAKLFLRNQSDFKVSVNISSIEKNITEKDWNKEFQTEYPFKIEAMKIKMINEQPINKSYAMFNEEQDDLKFELNTNKRSIIEIANNSDNKETVIDCDITLATTSIDYLPHIKISNV